MTSTSVAWPPAIPAAGRRGARPAVDVAIATGALLGTLVLLAHGVVLPGRPDGHGLDAAAVATAAAASLPLVAWRRFPLGVFAVTAAAATLLVPLVGPVELAPGPIVALFLLAWSRDRHPTSSRRTAVVVLGVFAGYLAACALARGGFPGAALLHTGLAWTTARLAGERVRLRRQRLDAWSAQARDAVDAAERERLLAVAEERARIARDLHDSAGHAISVIAVRAGAARLGHHRDPERSLAALAAIEELARNAVQEIDGMVGNLRDRSEPEAVTGPVGLASLDALLAHHGAAGLPVALTRSGTPRPLPGAVDQAAYRILQEALTNAARHGGGGADVLIRYGDGEVELAVTNPVDGPAGGAAAAPPGGHGLIGMRERATLLGGSLEAGRAERTFRVRARIPDAAGEPRGPAS